MRTSRGGAGWPRSSRAGALACRRRCCRRMMPTRCAHGLNQHGEGVGEPTPSRRHAEATVRSQHAPTGRQLATLGQGEAVGLGSEGVESHGCGIRWPPQEDLPNQRGSWQAGTSQVHKKGSRRTPTNTRSTGVDGRAGRATHRGEGAEHRTMGGLGRNGRG